MADSAGVEPFTFTAPLSVCVDVKHPLACLAFGPVQTLAEELAVAVDWLPFPTEPMKPPPPAAVDRGTRHRRTRARYLEADIERYAAAQGLVIRSLYRTADSTLASLGLLWIRRHAPEKSADYLQRVFTGYWGGQLDVEDRAALGEVLAQLDLDPRAFADFASGAGPGLLAAQREGLVAAGVFTVPSLVVEGEVFVGRAHLPMARWLLTGRAGPPPI